MKKVLTIGGAMHDIFIEYENPQIMHIQDGNPQSFILLEQGKKIEVNSVHDFIGGGATNSAVSFKKLGFNVTSFFKIGDDAAGEYILDTMNRMGIDINAVIITPDKKTGTSFIIPGQAGNQVALVYRGANVSLQPSDIPAQLIENCDLLYITSLSRDASHALKPIVQSAKLQEKMVAVNPGGSQISHSAGVQILCQSLPNIDIFILNAYEAKELMSCLLQSNPELAPKKSTTLEKNDLPQLLQESITFKTFCFNYMDYFREILSRGPKIAVVTNGAEGVYVAHKNEISFYPSPKVHVVSTLGAGDAFGSCFTGMLTLGKSIEDALIAGILNSGSVIGHIGTQSGLLLIDELENELKKADKKLLQKFKL